MQPFHSLLRLSGLSLFVAACAPAPTPTPPPPSVILISLDTLRAGHMGVYGYERETTPYLDELAKECLVFERAISVAPWTLISHVTMLTGLYPEQHGVVDKSVALSPKIPYLAERLRDRGYENFAFYKPGWIGEEYGHERGFDVFEEHEELQDARAHMLATERLGKASPFFLFLHLFDIHSDPVSARRPQMYRPPEPYDQMFIPDAHAKLEGVEFWLRQTEDIYLDDEQREALIALYDGKIRFVDDTLKEWIEGWRADGMLDNTILIITSDHGESLAQRGKLRGHGRMYQDALHIPLLVRFPDGYRAGEREGGTVSLVDIVPTVLHQAGLATDPRLPGLDLRNAAPEEDRIVGAMKPPQECRVRWPWKTVGSEANPGFLFHLDEDPMELRGRSAKGELGTTYAELHSAFDALIDGLPVFEGAEPIASKPSAARLRKNLKALGYLGDDEQE